MKFGFGEKSLAAIAAAVSIGGEAAAQQAQYAKPRLENARESYSAAAYPSREAYAYCKKLAERAWALVKRGKTVEAEGLNFEEVLECFPTERERVRFMDAHDAAEGRRG